MANYLTNLVWRFGYRFGNDNNFRLAVLWGLGVAHLIFNLTVFGFGPAAEFPASDTVQRYNNLEFHGRFVTDRELGTFVPGDRWGGVRRVFWGAWGVMFVANVIYIWIASRDERSRAWRAGVRAVRERRGSTSPAEARTPQAPAGQPPAPAAPQGGIARSEAWVIAREIMGATIANILTHRGGR